jgi:uncharacterized protein (DUF2384 family)
MTQATQNTLKDAGQVLGLTDNEIARAVRAERSTITRWRRGQGAQSAEQKTRIRQLREMIYLVKVVFPTAADGPQWLRSPSPRLHGETPAALVQGGRAEEVIEVLTSAPPAPWQTR